MDQVTAYPNFNITRFLFCRGKPPPQITHTSDVSAGSLFLDNPATLV
jgi:hypothetical protein